MPEDGKRRTRAKVVAIWSLGVIHAAIGLFLTIGGTMLLPKVDSLYYLAVGAAELIIAFMCFKRWGWSFVLYGSLLVGMLVWALTPRLLGPTVLGLLMLLLPTHRICGPPSRWWIGGPALATLVTIGLASGLALHGDRSHSPPAATAFFLTMRVPAEWHKLKLFDCGAPLCFRRPDQ
jgi:glucose dehydrogenase